MLDIKFVRTNPEVVKQNIRNTENLMRKNGLNRNIIFHILREAELRLTQM